MKLIKLQQHWIDPERISRMEVVPPDQSGNGFYSSTRLKIWLYDQPLNAISLEIEAESLEQSLLLAQEKMDSLAALANDARTPLFLRLIKALYKRFLKLFDQYSWAQKLLGGHWELWHVDFPVCSSLWHQTKKCSLVSGGRPTSICRGTPKCVDYGDKK